jgi:hypothetical protein
LHDGHQLPRVEPATLGDPLDGLVVVAPTVGFELRNHLPRDIAWTAHLDQFLPLLPIAEK